MQRPDFRRELAGLGTAYISACAKEEARILAHEASQTAYGIRCPVNNETVDHGFVALRSGRGDRGGDRAD